MSQTQENKAKIMVLEEMMKNNDKDHAEIKSGLEKIDIKLDTVIETKTDKSEFVFWRAVLVSGILVSIFLGIISMYLEKLVK